MILGIIPARAGSKGIPNKNTYPLLNKPLIEYTTEIMAQSNLEDGFIYTNDVWIQQKYKTWGIKRPEHLSENDTPMLPVIQEALKQYEIWGRTKVDAVMILQPTSPLRTIGDINKAIKAFKESGSDSLYSGYYMGIKHKEKTYDKHQDKPHFQRNGAIFIASRELIDQGKLWSDNVIEFEMPKSRSIDIDDMDDMFIAESLIKNGVLK